ncbi:hypothetical protein ACIOZM_22625 [Pseudomonas sp. NPDC087346]|uniref:hypothetical protein n=1 Tax=Pseudomonas sp. NPDC087346 TaxID=3364438 RepID=UPI0038003D5E
MDALANGFTEVQRRTLDRYSYFLGTLPQTFKNISVVFESRRNSGHQLAVLGKDSRLNNAPFNKRYLQAFLESAQEIARQYEGYKGDLATFTRESLEIARQTSRNESLDQVDFKLYSLSRSSAWQLFPPVDVQDLVHELSLRFFVLKVSIRQLKYTVMEVHDESLGLKSVFTKAMEYRSCHCHPTPTVAQELFRETRTAPAWDIAYSSREASVRAQEYRADIATLFDEFSAVSSKMSLFVEELYQRTDNVINELLDAKSASRLGELNFKLGGTMEGMDDCTVMVHHLESWLQK